MISRKFLFPGYQSADNRFIPGISLSRQLFLSGDIRSNDHPFHLGISHTQKFIQGLSLSRQSLHSGAIMLGSYYSYVGTIILIRHYFIHTQQTLLLFTTLQTLLLFTTLQTLLLFTTLQTLLLFQGYHNQQPLPSFRDYHAQLTFLLFTTQQSLLLFWFYHIQQTLLSFRDYHTRQPILLFILSRNSGVVSTLYMQGLTNSEDFSIFHGLSNSSDIPAISITLITTLHTGAN